MKTSERIAELDKDRGAKVAAMQELLEKSSSENRTLSDDENGVFNQLKTDIGTIQRDLDNLREMETIIAKHAQVAGVGSIVVRDQPIEKGVRFARYAKAILRANGNIPQAIEIAKAQWKDTPEVEAMLRCQNVGLIKAAVPAATTTDPAWAGALAQANVISNEMIDLVLSDAVIGKLTNVRRVQFNTRVPRVTATMGVAAWVGQGMSKPVGKAAFDLVTIPFTKASLITFMTEEEARFSTPAAEPLFARMLRDSIREFLDDQFVNSAVAPVVGVSPGGITNGLVAPQTFASSGDTLAHMQYDLALAVSRLNDNAYARSPVWIFHPARFTAVQAAINGFGAPAFPSAQGPNPTLFGYPVIVTSALLGTQVILMDQPMILLATDGGPTVDVSREASFQADSAPATPPTGMISLWQQNMIGLRCEQFIHWQRARDTGFVLITSVDWGTVPPAAGGLGADTAAREQEKREREEKARAAGRPTQRGPGG